jgi:antitoxin PrlF
MPIATLTSKGQMTLPKSVRDDLNVGPGDQLVILKEGDHYVLRAKSNDLTSLYGALWQPGQKGMTVEELDDALGEALAEDDERIRAGR